MDPHAASGIAFFLMCVFVTGVAWKFWRALAAFPFVLYIMAMLLLPQLISFGGVNPLLVPLLNLFYIGSMIVALVITWWWKQRKR